MKLTVLGCGTSTGVPIALCECKVCKSDNPRNKRSRCSVLLTDEVENNIIIDVGPDFRNQALRAGFKSINYSLFTHHHADHILGIDDLRPFYFAIKRNLDFYANQRTIKEIQRIFSYMFEANEDYSGPPLPKICMHKVKPFESFTLGSEEIMPLPVFHGRLEILAYRIRNFAYLTDCNAIPDATLDHLGNLDYLIIDGLRKKPHPSHFSIDEVLPIIKKLNPKKTYLTHTSHDLEYDETNKTLPANIELAYDGLSFNF